MIILGIASEHCSSAALMVDDEIVGLIQEERFSKKKNQVAFPLAAIKSLVDQHLAGDATRIDKVVFGGQISDPVYAALDRFSNFSVSDHVLEQHELWYPHFYGDVPNDGTYWIRQFEAGKDLNEGVHYDFSWLNGMSHDDAVSHFVNVERPAAVRRHLECRDDVIIESIDHHQCHAYYALYGGQIGGGELDDMLILTADGWGDGCNWSASVVAEDGRLECIGSGDRHAVARLYKWATLVLGMKPNEHEYKVMGLSAYSNYSSAIESAEKILFEAVDFRDGEFVSEKPLVDSYFDLKNRMEGIRFDVFAAALQNWATALCKAWVKHWLDVTGKRKLCMSGGLSMNIKTNADILNMPELDWLSVPASGGDESLSAGACYAAASDAEKIHPLQHVYLGGAAVADGWDARLSEAGVSDQEFCVYENFGPAAAARLLAEDHVVARCVGRAEFGARSLGNRSILANPANPANVKLINDTIKNRDFWMPFTPSMLAEDAGRYLINPKGAVCQFMTIGFESNPDTRHEIAGAVHPADYSVRPQFVDQKTNPEYWALIDQFRQLTGVSAVLNTSLNLHGEPMNYTTADAARTLALSELDFLLMPNDKLLFKKSAQAKLDTIF